MTCDICGKNFNTLGGYGNGERWWLCYKCFEKADKLAALEDRWPDNRDFRHMREKIAK